MAQVTYLEAIRQALLEEMERDPSVLLLGEDIGVYGGAFKVDGRAARALRLGARDRYADQRDRHRRRGRGHELLGLRPVAEMQFMDFIACAFNQITNYVAKSHYLLGRAGADRDSRARGRRRARRAVSFRESGDVFRAHAGVEGGLSGDGLRRQGPAEIGDSRQQSGALFRAQVALPAHQGRAARARNTRCRWARPSSGGPGAI